MNERTRTNLGIHLASLVVDVLLHPLLSVVVGKLLGDLQMEKKKKKGNM